MTPCDPARGRARRAPRRRASRSCRARRCAPSRRRSRRRRTRTARGSSTSVLRSTTTASGAANAACTAVTASAGVRPPTLDARDADAGRNRRAAARRRSWSSVTVVVVAAVVVGRRRAGRGRRDVEVVTSAITVPENVPAQPRARARRETDCSRALHGAGSVASVSGPFRVVGDDPVDAERRRGGGRWPGRSPSSRARARRARGRPRTAAREQSVWCSESALARAQRSSTGTRTGIACRSAAAPARGQRRAGQWIRDDPETVARIADRAGQRGRDRREPPRRCARRPSRRAPAPRARAARSRRPPPCS